MIDNNDTLEISDGLSITYSGIEYEIVEPIEKWRTMHVGELLCHILRVDLNQLKKILSSYPEMNEQVNADSAVAALKWLQTELISKTDYIIGVVVTSEILFFFDDVLSDKLELVDEINEPEHSSDSSFVFSDSPYSGPGYDDIGNILFTAFLHYVIYHHLVENLFDSYANFQNLSSLGGQINKLHNLENINFKIFTGVDRFRELFQLKNIWSIFVFEIVHLTQNLILPIRCKNCGQWFVPANRSDTIYCDYPSPQDPIKTCKIEGAALARALKEKMDEATGLYRKIYMSKQMLCRRNPDIEAYSLSFEHFKQESKIWLANIKIGSKTREEYIEWLKSVKEKKT